MHKYLKGYTIYRQLVTKAKERKRKEKRKEKQTKDSKQNNNIVCIPYWAVGRWCIKVKPKAEEKSVQETESE